MATDCIRGEEEKNKKKSKKRYAVTHSLLTAFGAHVVDVDL